MNALASVDALMQALRDEGYLPDRRLATAVFLALQLQRPLLLEGSPAWQDCLARSMARALQRVLIRLQCYDGMEQREALYEWNYAAQLCTCVPQKPRAALPTWARRAGGVPRPLPHPPRRCCRPRAHLRLGRCCSLTR